MDILFICLFAVISLTKSVLFVPVTLHSYLLLYNQFIYFCSHRIWKTNLKSTCRNILIRATFIISSPSNTFRVITFNKRLSDCKTQYKSRWDKKNIHWYNDINWVMSSTYIVSIKDQPCLVFHSPTYIEGKNFIARKTHSFMSN